MWWERRQVHKHLSGPSDKEGNSLIPRPFLTQMVPFPFEYIQTIEGREGKKKRTRFCLFLNILIPAAVVYHQRKCRLIIGPFLN